MSLFKKRFESGNYIESSPTGNCTPRSNAACISGDIQIDRIDAVTVKVEQVLGDDQAHVIFVVTSGIICNIVIIMLIKIN